MAECSHITPQRNARKDTGSRPRKGPFLLSWKLCCPCDFQAAPTLSPQLHSLGAGELLCEQTPNTAKLPSIPVPLSPPGTAACLRTFSSCIARTDAKTEAEKPLGPQYANPKLGTGLFTLPIPFLWGHWRGTKGSA